MSFVSPSKQYIERIQTLFPKTNRYIVDSNIRIYNEYLKYTVKKFYVENTVDIPLVSFFRKNNKILLNFNRLKPLEMEFLLSTLSDLLRNVEVVQMNERTFNDYKHILQEWDGNVILEG